MAAHKFTAGQRVAFSPDRLDSNAPRGTYTVVRRMPSETRDLQYRIKDTRDGHERVVRESRLART